MLDRQQHHTNRVDYAGNIKKMILLSYERGVDCIAVGEL